MISFIRPQIDNVEPYIIGSALFCGLFLVFLIMIIVMMPLATVYVESDLQSRSERLVAVNLPASTAEPQPRPDHPTYLTVKADLTLWIGNDPVSLERLDNALNAATKGDKDTRIFLRADKAISCGEMMEVMNLLRAAGYLKVALVAKQRSD